MNYEEIFRERGGAYHHAMQRWPEARRDEFRLPVARAALAAGHKVIDVPAGGGYLQRYLPAGCEWLGHEPCASFLDDDSAPNRGLLPLPWADGYADAAISVAGVHHLDDKRPLFAELRRVLKPGGRFVLADAHEHSPVARFLDDFVGSYNRTGHEGAYLGDHTLDELRAGGFEVLAAERCSYCWWFSDRLQMGAFCRLLFDMQRLDDETVATTIEQRLGTVERAGEIGMHWELLVVVADKRT